MVLARIIFGLKFVSTMCIGGIKHLSDHNNIDILNSKLMKMIIGDSLTYLHIFFCLV